MVRHPDLTFQGGLPVKHKHFVRFAAVIALLALCLSGCGNDSPAPTVPTSQDLPLGLASASLSASTWSSPNGATVHLSATPTRHAPGDAAQFVVRLEGEEAASVPCDFDGTQYVASADLNAEDGYCYYIVFTAADGTRQEVDINSPAQPTNDALINIAASLDTYCNLMVEGSRFDGSVLTLTAGMAQLQLPRITNAGESIVCKEAVLALEFDGQIVDKKSLTLTELDERSACQADLAGLAFSVPTLEDDQQVHLRLDVTLSNGQTLTASGSTWYASGGDLLLSVG